MKTINGKIDLRPAPSIRRPRRTRSFAAALLVLLLALILPVIAVYQRSLDLRAIGVGAAYAVVINVITFWTYAVDKRRAEIGEWRISETHLHLLELLGGWPGAWLAQRRLRHKCSKAAYQFVFWLIVLGYQFAAFDAMQDWKFSRVVLSWTRRIS